MSSTEDRARRISTLQRLTATEIQALRHRCGGRTSEDIASLMGIPPDTARNLLASVYDKLGVTWDQQASSLTAVNEYCPLLTDPALVTPVPMGQPDTADQATAPLPSQPSERALLLVDEDDAALLARRGTVSSADAATDDGRKIPLFVFGIIAIVAVGALLVLLFQLAGDDDDDDASAAADETATQQAVATGAATAQAGANPAATEAPAGQPTSVPAPTETPVPPTDTPEPTETPTTAPTEAPTSTPEPTEPPPTPTSIPATSTAAPPPPASGTMVYEANWSAGAGDWTLPDGWAAQDGALVSDGNDAGQLAAPFAPTGNNYAIEADLSVTGGSDDCPDGVGLFGRMTSQSSAGVSFDAGYFGLTCASQWQLAATRENAEAKDTVSEGDYQPADGPHTYRLELDGQSLRLYVDGEFVGEATDDRWTEPGNAGIYVSGDYLVRVTGFRVFALQ